MGHFGPKKFPIYVYLVLAFLYCTTSSTASSRHHADTSVLRKLNTIHQKTYEESRNVQISQRHPNKPVWNQRYFHKLVNRIHHLRHNPTEDTGLQHINRQANGFSGDRCDTDADCVEPRKCIAIEDEEIVNCNDSGECICLPEALTDSVCSCNNLECLDGDVCVGVGDEGGSLCVATDNENFTPLECISPSPSPSPSVSESTRPGEGNSFTGDPCEVINLDCAGGRVCVDRVNDETVPCASPFGCFCIPINRNDLLCSCENPECLEGDRCSDIADGIIGCGSINQEEFSPIACETASASPSPGPSGPIITQITRPPPPRPTPPDCIDAKALSHMDRLQLLYEPHVVSRVLCDKFGSCATAGHIVFYKGTPMMMMKYCEKVGCESRVIEVNSPRYQRGMRLPSKTADLEYSVFAARYGTRAEEVALVTAIRLGL